MLQQSFPGPGKESVCCARIYLDPVKTVMPFNGENMSRDKNQQYSLLTDLIKRSQEGDVGAMEALYKEFRAPLFNLAYRYTHNRAVAEDLLHDIFIKVFHNIHSLDVEKAFVSWIYRVAVNSCLTYLRKNKSPVKRAVSLEDIRHLKEDPDDDNIREKAFNRSLDSAMQDLPGKLKSVFLLHDYQGFKHKEIAEIMGWSIGTSKSQLFKARKKIRKTLQSRDEF